MGIAAIDTKDLQALGDEQDVDLDLGWLNPGTDGGMEGV